MSPSTCRPFTPALFVVPVVAALWGIGSARADNLDAPLAGYTEKDVLTALKLKDVKHVGVLPFRVKKGKAAESFLSAPLCQSMTTRLENTLILVDPQNPEDTIGIIRDAALTASHQKGGAWFKDAAARKKLFDLTYTPAYGTAKVKADAFLTGVIESPGREGKVKVKIEMFTRKSPELVKVSEFSVEPDRYLLADLGYNFNLSRTAVRSRSTRERDRMVVSLVRRRDEGQPPPPGSEVTTATPENVGGFTVGVLYGDRPVEIKPLSEGSTDTTWTLPAIPPGTEFTLELTYNGRVDGNLGVIVTVNGKSTWQQESGDSITLRKWLYDRSSLNKVDAYKGFYLDEKQYLPFKVLGVEESAARANEFGDRAGWIQIDVFASGDQPSQTDEPKRVTSRGLPRAVDPKTKRFLPVHFRSLADAQKQLAQVNHVKRSLVRGRSPDEGGLIVPGDSPITVDEVKKGQLPNPVLIGTLKIRYYNPTTPLRVTPGTPGQP
jgi:hypothetical protein